MKKIILEKGLVKWILSGLLLFDFAFFCKSRGNGMPIELKLVDLLVLDMQILPFLLLGLCIIWLLDKRQIHRAIFPRR